MTVITFKVLCSSAHLNANDRHIELNGCFLRESRMNLWNLNMFSIVEFIEASLLCEKSYATSD